MFTRLVYYTGNKNINTFFIFKILRGMNDMAYLF